MIRHLNTLRATERTRRDRKARSGGAKSFQSVDGSLGSGGGSVRSDGLSAMAPVGILVLRLPSNTKTPVPTNGRGL